MALLKITFDLDGAGLHYNPHSPIHLDDIIAWTLAPILLPKEHRNPARDQPPVEFDLPIMRTKYNGIELYKASALLPVGNAQYDLVHWRKKFNTDRINHTKGSPNLQNGVYREYNQPLPLLLVNHLEAYVESTRREMRRLLSQVRYLGKKRSQGFGKIANIDIIEIYQDFSLFREGKAMRYLPDSKGSKLVRVKPPYWNITNRIRCLNVGDDI